MATLYNNQTGVTHALDGLFIWNNETPSRLCFADTQTGAQWTLVFSTDELHQIHACLFVPERDTQTRIADAAERQNVLFAEYLIAQDYRFREWLGRKGFGDLLFKNKDDAAK